eukprot:m.75036 g.75036  ORF g.75036 m.75036 type:complete len:323 (+) comp14554_c0_seq1:275-1243(+)
MRPRKQSEFHTSPHSRTAVAGVGQGGLEGEALGVPDADAGAVVVVALAALAAVAGAADPLPALAAVAALAEARVVALVKGQLAAGAVVGLGGHVGEASDEGVGLVLGDGGSGGCRSWADEVAVAGLRLGEGHGGLRLRLGFRGKHGLGCLAGEGDAADDVDVEAAVEALGLGEAVGEEVDEDGERGLRAGDAADGELNGEGDKGSAAGAEDELDAGVGVGQLGVGGVEEDRHGAQPQLGHRLAALGLGVEFDKHAEVVDVPAAHLAEADEHDVEEACACDIGLERPVCGGKRNIGNGLGAGDKLRLELQRAAVGVCCCCCCG